MCPPFLEQTMLAYNVLENGQTLGSASTEMAVCFIIMHS